MAACRPASWWSYERSTSRRRSYCRSSKRRRIRPGLKPSSRSGTRLMPGMFDPLMSTSSGCRFRSRTTGTCRWPLLRNERPRLRVALSPTIDNGVPGCRKFESLGVLGREVIEATLHQQQHRPRTTRQDRLTRPGTPAYPLAECACQQCAVAGPPACTGCRHRPSGRGLRRPLRLVSWAPNSCRCHSPSDGYGAEPAPRQQPRGVVARAGRPQARQLIRWPG